MNYIIDGYNLGFKISTIEPVLKRGQTDLAIKQISQYVKNKLSTQRGRVIIVFDGRDFHGKAISQLAGIKLIFSRKPQTADDIIRKFIRETTQVENWTVVSSDNEIRFTAQDHGAKVLKSSEFTGKSFSKGKRGKPIPNNKTNPENVDIEYWQKLFEEGNNE
jgi:predicted RNA-binding protein with PIN domain